MRPVDWQVLDLERDPTPGEPSAIRSLAARVLDVGQDAAAAERDLRSLAGDGSVRPAFGQPGGGTQHLVDGDLLGLDLPPGTRVDVDWLANGYLAPRPV